MTPEHDPNRFSAKGFSFLFDYSPLLSGQTCLDTEAAGNGKQLKAKIVHLIIGQKTEEALELLSRYHHVPTPKLKVGMPKGDVKHQGCYIVRNETIYVANMDNLYNPYIVLHEFYHHLRTKGAIHRGTEKNADKFAKDYIATYYRFFGA
jgi:hypothetical protein